jgi:hypothetical protein
MTDQILFDRLVYVDRLKRAGISEDQARAHAEAFDGALREAVATKADLVLVNTEIIAVRTDLDRLAVRLENRIEVGLRDVTIRIGGMLIVAVGILIGFGFKFFGH